jgi:hypothetical protein
VQILTLYFFIAIYYVNLKITIDDIQHETKHGDIQFSASLAAELPEEPKLCGPQLCGWPSTEDTQAFPAAENGCPGIEGKVHEIPSSSGTCWGPTLGETFMLPGCTASVSDPGSMKHVSESS